jgi:hypothetical protein
MSATIYAMLDAEVLKRVLEDRIPIDIELYIHDRLIRLAQAEDVEEPTTEIIQDESSLFDSRYRTMEAAALRLQKEAKGYLDSLRGMLDCTAFDLTFQDGG